MTEREPEPPAAPPVASAVRWRLQLARGAQAAGPDGRAHQLSWRDGALLAWLAVEGPTPRARLATLLWPDSAPESARNSLRQRLFQLRKQCGDELVAGTTTLALAAGVSHDLEDSDGVLGETAAEASGEFTGWLEQQRARRRQRSRAAIEELAEMAERARDWPDALAHARELLALEPLSEEAHRRAMRLHYLAGDRAAALLAFDRCEQLLKNEVGARPSAETLALLATIEAADAHGAASAVAPGRAVPASVLRPPRLIGRDAQWHALQEAFDVRRLCVVRGEGGMGKSRLVGDFARSRPRVLVVGARPGDEGVAYASVSRLVRALPPQAVAAWPDALRDALARLMPEWGAAPPLRSAADRAHFFRAVAVALGHPAVGLHGVVFDDLHFADEASIELLRFLVTDVPIGWALAVRPADVSEAGQRMLDECSGESEVQCIDLPPLTPAQIEALVDSLGVAGLRGAAHAQALWQRTGGNPLFLLETIKAGWQQGNAAAATTRLPGPTQVGQLIQRRIGRLSREAVALARCAAIAAPDFSIELASQVLGQRTLDLADPWAELEAAQVLRADGAFAHDLIYEAAVASVPQAVARQLHGEVAGFLSAGGGEPARLARHWAGAHRWARASTAYGEAARRAREAGQAKEQCALLAEAAACAAQAGDGPARFALLHERALALSQHDSGEAALRAIDELQALAAGDDERLQALAARLELAATRFEIDEILRVGPPALEQARALQRDELAMRMALVCSAAYGDARRTAEGVAVLGPSIAWVRSQPESELTWSFWEAYALALDYDNRLREAADGWLECQRLAQSLGRNDLLWRSNSNAASGLAKLGLLDDAVELSGRAWRLARTLGETGRVRLLQTQAPHAHRLRDAARYSEALPLLLECLEGFRREGSTTDISLTEQRLSLLYMQLGQPARAVPLLADERSDGAIGVVMFRQVLRAELARLLNGDALAKVRAALAMIGSDDDIFWRMGSLYASAIVPPDEGEAMAAALALWAGARERRGLALAGHVRAAGCACKAGAPSRAAPHVDAALQLARDHRPDSFYLAELWLTAASTYTALGQRDKAAQALRSGREWIQQVAAAHVPPEFRDSFLHRNPVNRELLALAARLA